MRGHFLTILSCRIPSVPSLPFFVGTTNWDAAQCDVKQLQPSPSGNILAYSVDGSGYETYNIRLKDLKTGEELDEQIVDTAGSVAWVGGENLFYVKFDEVHRPYQVCDLPPSPLPSPCACI